MADWRRFIVSAGAVFGGVLAVVGLLLVAMNPFGNLPASFFRAHTIMDTNQRYQYPAIVRSGVYDSVVIGTSTSRLLKPEALQSVFGGRFANLAFDSGRAWEQSQIAGLAARELPRHGTLIIGLDHVWCFPDADVDRITPRGFPEWMYEPGGGGWISVRHMLNMRAVEIAGRRLAHTIGRAKPRFPHDGYEVFLPPDSQYDRAKVERLVFGPGGRREIKPEPTAYIATADERRSLRFPALEWLPGLIARDTRWARVVLLLTPIHIVGQPIPGSRAAAVEGECKRRMAEIARAADVSLVDFRIWSAITRETDNYWDPLHYRVEIADRIVGGIRRALETGADDPAGDYRVLTIGKRSKLPAR